MSGFITIGALFVCVLAIFALGSQTARNKALKAALLAEEETKAKAAPRRRVYADSEDADLETGFETDAVYREVGPDGVPPDARSFTPRSNKTSRSSGFPKSARTASADSTKDNFREPSFDTVSSSFTDVAYSETMMDSPSSKFDL